MCDAGHERTLHTGLMHKLAPLHRRHECTLILEAICDMRQLGAAGKHAASLRSRQLNGSADEQEHLQLSALIPEHVAGMP